MSELLQKIQSRLNAVPLADNLTPLFCESLRWGAPSSRAPRAIAVGAPLGRTLTATPVAQLTGLPVFRVDWPEDRPPTLTQRRAVHRALAPIHAEHLLCYLTRDRRQTSFVWARKRPDGKTELRTLPYEVGSPARTTIERLGELAWTLDELGPTGQPRITAVTAKLRTAFDKEPVTRKFFEDYCDVFEKTAHDIANRHPRWSTETVEHEAQTLLNRLLFLYFIQRKGWLNRERDFLVRHFREHFAQNPRGTTYLADFLRPVFVKLSTKGPQADIPGFDLPFLNGGLFADEYGAEQRDDDVRRRHELKVGNDTFQHIFDELLEPYNFTVREDTPLDIEVAIDPEMLGKIFESLVLQLELSGSGGKSSRHDTGSYYTPRPIVHYLCCDALAAWLEDQPPFAGKPDARERIAKLLSLDASDGIDQAERATLDSLLTPEEARALADRLYDLRACDLAVGSGAFPVALLHESVNLARLCETRARGRDPVAADPRWLFDTKTRFVERCLYGVDIQARAIEICKLRLWLSLVVDYPLDVDVDSCERQSFREALRKLPALPNLDFKIRRANSLVDMIRGEPVPLGRLHSGRDAQLVLNRLAAAKRGFYNADSVPEKRRLRFAIYEATAELAQIELTVARNDLGLIPDPANAEKVAELDRAQKEMGAVLAEIRAARKLKAADQDDALERLRDRFDDPQKPTFVWQLDFAEVFHRDRSAGVPPASSSTVPVQETECGPSRGGKPLELAVGTAALQGFDLITANPPYVDSETMTRNDLVFRQTLAKNYRVAKGNWDLFVVFIEKALNLLAQNGVMSYIVPNKLIGAPYAEAIRRMLSEYSIREIRDYSRINVFAEAAVYPVTVVAQKSDRLSPTSMTLMKSIEEVEATNRLAPGALDQRAQWAQHFGKSASLSILQKCATFPSLRSFFPDITGAATVSEAYELKKCLQEFTGREKKPFLKLVNTGTIDRYSVLWGVKPTRYIKASYKKPLVFDEDILAINPNRLKQARSPKIVIGGMTLKLECAYDEGHCLAGKSTTIILGCERLDLKYALGILNSRLITFWYRTQYKALTLAGGYLRISGNEIGSIPIPVAERAEHNALVGLVERILAAKHASPSADTAELEGEIDERVYRLYGLTADEIRIIDESGGEAGGGV